MARRHHLEGKLVRATPLRLDAHPNLSAPEPPSEVIGLLSATWVPTLRVWRYAVAGHSVDPGSAVAVADPGWST